jgi:C4-dicarboxylate transporter/malic acid transport protein
VRVLAEDVSVDSLDRPWFSATMSTGALAVVLGKTPNKFPGLTTIGEIVFIFDLILFVVFTGLMTTRFVLVPRKMTASLHHPVEGLFHGTFWVSVALILNCAHVYGHAKTGDWLTKALEICFWIYCACAFSVSIAQYSMFFRLERLQVTSAVPAWIFPIYPLLVVGTLAGTILPSQPDSASWKIFIGGVLFQGVAWLVSFLMYGIYMQRLMTSNLPSATVRPGMYVSVGPAGMLLQKHCNLSYSWFAGYTAASMFSLAKQAPRLIPPNYFTDTAVPDGEIVRLIGIMAGLFVVLFAYWFFFITTIAIFAGIRKMKFSLNWWAFIFPNAGLTLATIQAASALKSEAMKGVASALTVLLVVMWFIVSGFNIRALWLGDVMWPGKDEDKSMERLAWGWRGNRKNDHAQSVGHWPKGKD